MLYGLMLLEERYPTQGPYREQLIGEVVAQARRAARAALRYLRVGGSVPGYLLELRDHDSARLQELGEYRDRARRANLGLLPSDDRGWKRKRNLDRERYLKRRRRAEPVDASRQTRAAAPSNTRASGPSSGTADLQEVVGHLARGMAGLALPPSLHPDLRAALAPPVLALHRFELALILTQIGAGLELLLEMVERDDRGESTVNT